MMAMKLNQRVAPRLVAALLMIAGLQAGAAARAEGSVKVTTGYDYSSGDYGQDLTTEIEYVPVSVEYINNAWSAKLTVPYIQVTGNGTVVPGSGGLVIFSDFDSGTFGSSMFPSGTSGSGAGTSSATETVTNSGLGDVVASLGYGFLPKKTGGAFYEIKAKVKVATADEKQGLGTGENDYFLEFNAMLPEAAVTPFFTVGYVVTGDGNKITYDDVFYGTVGLMVKAGAGNSFGLTYDYRQAAVDGADDFGLAGIYWSSRYSAAWSSMLTVSAGVTDASPDYGASFLISRTF